MIVAVVGTSVLNDSNRPCLHGYHKQLHSFAASLRMVFKSSITVSL